MHNSYKTIQVLTDFGYETLYVCPDCSAIVEDTVLHEQSHPHQGFRTLDDIDDYNRQAIEDMAKKSAIPEAHYVPYSDQS